jgi:tetratricopeptide (TPR) repeat protein
MPCALLSSDAQRALRPHVTPLLKKRLRAQKAKGTAKTSIGLGISFASLLFPYAAILNLLGAVKDGFETGKAGKEWRDAIGDHDMIDFEEAQSLSHGEADTAAMSFLNAFLDASDTDVPTVPVILILDDAQWADMVTLRFVRQLFAHAWKRNLPLLVLATCWEREWKTREAELVSHLPRNADPENLNVVFGQLARTLGLEASSALHKIRLGRFSKVNDLAPILHAALPGIKGEARDYLLAAADGNPQQLVEMIKALRALPHRQWFENRSLEHNLTANGLAQLRALSTDRKKMLGDRITRLAEEEPDVFTALTLGSLQGIRFYAEVISAVSQQTGHELPRGVTLALARAEDPHNWISNFPSSFPAAEFKEYLGRELVRDCIAEEEATHALNALRSLLTEWFTSRRMEELSEKAEICLLLVRLLPAGVQPDSEAWALRCAVITRCVDWFYVQWRRGEAVALATEFCAWVKPFEISNVIAAIDLPARLSLPRALLDAQDYDASVKFATAALTTLPASHVPEQVALYKTIGKAELGRETFAGAIRAFQAAIELTKSLHPEVQYVSGRLTRLHRELGSVLSEADRHRAAFRECKKALRTLPHGGRQTPNSPIQLRVGAQILGQISRELYHSGKLFLANRVILRALELFEKCQELGDTTPVALEHHAHALIRIGNYRLYKIGGTPPESVSYFQRALQLQQRIVERLGETPRVLTDLASCYSNYAGGLITIERHLAAQQAVEEALRLRRRVLSRVGDQIEALRDFSLTLVKQADILRDSQPPELVLAQSSLRKALEVRNSIIDRWGPRQKDLRLLHFVWRKQGEIDMLRSDAEGALEIFSRARQILRHLARVKEAQAEKKGFLSPEFLRLRHVCSEKIAEAAERCHHAAQARAALRFALVLNHRLQKGFEASQTAIDERHHMIKFAERMGIRSQQLVRDHSRSFTRGPSA